MALVSCTYGQISSVHFDGPMRDKVTRMCVGTDSTMPFGIMGNS